jgi:epoxide hydrolase 4
VTPADLQVEHHFTDLDGGFRLHWVEAGKGPLVVLLHGFPETWWSWRYQIGPLAAAGFRVVAIDLRGFGESDQAGPYTMDQHVSDVCKLIESLGETQARIVGHDWGGAIAWQLAATRAERCERLAVLNCPHLTIMRKRLFNTPRQLSKSWYMFFFQLPMVPEWVFTRDDAALIPRLLKASNVHRGSLADDEVRPFRDAVKKPGNASSMLGIYRAVFRQYFTGKLRTPSLITSRTLMIWGLDDPALGFDDLVPGTEKYVPHLKVEPVGGAGHFVQSDAPDAVNKLLVGWLK